MKGSGLVVTKTHRGAGNIYEVAGGTPLETLSRTVRFAKAYSHFRYKLTFGRPVWSIVWSPISREGLLRKRHNN